MVKGCARWSKVECQRTDPRFGLDRLEGRRVVIAFDADAAAKDQVRFARAEFAQHFTPTKVHSSDFWNGIWRTAKGIDDHLASVGPEAVFGEVSRVTSPCPWGAAPNWSGHEDRLTAEWLQRKGILVDVGTAAQAAQTVSKDRSFHPVRQYLESTVWDGVNRLDTWLATYLGVHDSNYVRAVGARWLIGRESKPIAVSFSRARKAARNPPR